MTAAPIPARLRVAITGASGFLGGRLVARYADAGASVRALVHESPANDLAASGAEIVRVDLLSDAGLAQALDGQDLVIHAAARTRAHSPAAEREMVAANVSMTRNVVEASRKAGVPTLLHVGSTAGIGIAPKPDTPADETFAYNLAQLGLAYSRSKQEAEQAALAANGDGLRVTVAHPGFVFGPHAGRYRGGDVIHRVLARPTVVCTNGGISIVHVDDVVDGIVRAAASEAAGERFILTGSNLSFREIAETVCRVASVRRRIITVPDVVRDLAGTVARVRAKGRAPNLALMGPYAFQYYSANKAREALGFRTRPFEAIVAEYLDTTSARPT